MSSRIFYLTEAGVVEGPVSLQDLIKLRDTGELPPTTRVRAEVGEKWTVLSELSDKVSVPAPIGDEDVRNDSIQRPTTVSSWARTAFYAVVAGICGLGIRTCFQSSDNLREAISSSRDFHAEVFAELLTDYDHLVHAPLPADARQGLWLGKLQIQADEFRRLALRADDADTKSSTGKQKALNDSFRQAALSRANFNLRFAALVERFGRDDAQFSAALRYGARLATVWSGNYAGPVSETLSEFSEANDLIISVQQAADMVTLRENALRNDLANFGRVAR